MDHPNADISAKEYDCPWVYAVPTYSGDTIQAIRAAIGARGKARQHNINFFFNAITEDKPRIGAGSFLVPMLDPGSSTTDWKLEPGDYFITMRSDTGMFRESLSLDLKDGKLHQKIRILDDADRVIFQGEMP